MDIIYGYYLMDILQVEQGDTLDRLIYRHYGITAGLVEIALKQNPILASLPILTMGQKVKMPGISSTARVATNRVNLWD